VVWGASVWRVSIRRDVDGRMALFLVKIERTGVVSHRRTQHGFKAAGLLDRRSGRIDENEIEEPNLMCSRWPVDLAVLPRAILLGNVVPLLLAMLDG
jgi:hypothetical protein